MIGATSSCAQAASSSREEQNVPGRAGGGITGDFSNAVNPSAASGKKTVTFAGVDGVLGLDYKFNGAPINMSLDWQPSFEFGTNRGFYGNWGGLGIRYTF